ncbi:MAG TPA: hypothetical protein VN934_06070 [Candidatus Tumulicola sp.]|nr:hypothetical protein [Candidatus Tumulicola sp.]
MSKLGELFVAVVTDIENDGQTMMDALKPILNRDPQGRQVGTIVGEFFKKQGDSGTIPGGAFHNLRDVIDYQAKMFGLLREELVLLGTLSCLDGPAKKCVQEIISDFDTILSSAPAEGASMTKDRRTV